MGLGVVFPSSPSPWIYLFLDFQTKKGAEGGRGERDPLASPPSRGRARRGRGGGSQLGVPAGWGEGRGSRRRPGRSPRRCARPREGDTGCARPRESSASAGARTAARVPLPHPVRTIHRTQVIHRFIHRGPSRRGTWLRPRSRTYWDGPSRSPRPRGTSSLRWLRPRVCVWSWRCASAHPRPGTRVCPRISSPSISRVFSAVRGRGRVPRARGVGPARCSRCPRSRAGSCPEIRAGCGGSGPRTSPHGSAAPKSPRRAQGIPQTWAEPGGSAAAIGRGSGPSFSFPCLPFLARFSPF